MICCQLQAFNKFRIKRICQGPLSRLYLSSSYRSLFNQSSTQMGAIITFFAQLMEKDQPKASPKNTKDAHVINVANLNYCGIMKSPFQFYSGKFQHQLEDLSFTFDKLRLQYVPWIEEKSFTWQFAKLDKKIKDRYCPFYNIHCGIEDNKFVSKKRFAELWRESYNEQERITQSNFSEGEKKQALAFDMLAFHTLLFKLFKILDIDQASKCSVQEYLKVYTPYFAQSFLDEKKKLQQFKKGMNESMADVVFVQQPDQLLIDDVQKFKEKYFISISPDKDTLIFAKKSRFNEQKESVHMLSRLTIQEQGLLDWNKHTSTMFLDNYFLISGHLNSKKAENQVNVKELMKIMPIIMDKYADLDIIVGMDANSFIPGFNQRLHMFPDSAEQYTTIKKRTSMQVQTSKAEKLVQENKDAIMTTLPFKMKQILTISGHHPSDKEYLPLDDHPFDHYLVFAVLEEKRK